MCVSLRVQANWIDCVKRRCGWSVCARAVFGLAAVISISRQHLMLYFNVLFKLRIAALGIYRVQIGERRHNISVQAPVYSFFLFAFVELIILPSSSSLLRWICMRSTNRCCTEKVSTFCPSREIDWIRILRQVTRNMLEVEHRKLLRSICILIRA